MITFEADLYVDSVHERSEYDQRIDCRADLDESSSKYPQKITITIGKKSFDKFPSDIGVNDMIHAKLYPTTRNGISKTSGKAYSITDLRVMDLHITKRANMPTNQENDLDTIDNCPF